MRFQYPLSGRRLCSFPCPPPPVSRTPFQYPLSGRRLCSAVPDCRRRAETFGFQYPLSGRRLCSSPPPLGRCVTRGVSVPSIGSKAVQPDLFAAAVDFHVSFQYPLSGRRLCSHGVLLAGYDAPGGFSTLYRVEGCAAQPGHDFGFALFDVSVPSIGSKAVQRASLARLFRRRLPVSVPSIGSKAVQLYLGMDDENRWFVSVPSIGSKAVQQSMSKSPISFAFCFSTLYRVEGCAAERDGIAAMYRAGFSTLYRVEGCAAGQRRERTVGRHRFQYPLSGRRLCSSVRAGSAPARRSVSVPSIGSKAVQRVDNRSRKAKSERVQYPLSGRRLCSRI